MRRCDCPTELDEVRLDLHLSHCPPRDMLLVRLGLETGLRISELLSLKICDVWQRDHAVSLLRVARARLKGGRGVRARSVSSRAIPLNAAAQEAIQRAFENGSDVDLSGPLFPGRKGTGAITRRHASRVIGEVFRAAGLDPHRTWAGHSLRRRFARRVFEVSGSLEITRAALGHRWVTTTQTYVGLGEDEAANAILRLCVRRGGDAENEAEPTRTVAQR
jgi:site-specific recombinase XerD